MAGLLPETTKKWALIAVPLNLVPGVGTMVAAGNREDLRPFAIGLVQFLLLFLAIAIGVVLPIVAGSVFLLDLAWSLTWGVLAYARAT